MTVQTHAHASVRRARETHAYASLQTTVLCLGAEVLHINWVTAQARFLGGEGHQVTLQRFAGGGECACFAMHGAHKGAHNAEVAATMAAGLVLYVNALMPACEMVMNIKCHALIAKAPT